MMKDACIMERALMILYGGAALQVLIVVAEHIPHLALSSSTVTRVCIAWRAGAILSIWLGSRGGLFSRVLDRIVHVM